MRWSHDGHGTTASELCEISEGHSSHKVSKHSHVVKVSNCAKDLTTSKVGLQLEVPGVSKALESDVTFTSNLHGPSSEGQSGTPFLSALQSSKPFKDFSKQEPVSINLRGIPDAPTLCKSRSSGRSKGSVRTKTTTVSEADNARIKLELARLVQRQNEERLRLEAEMERRRVEMEVNIRREELEMKRLKILAEDQRNVEVAELEASLCQNRTGAWCIG